MAWSIFTQGGGDGAAVTWAQDLLSEASSDWGVNVDTPGNQQFIYDWEKSEGGGGEYNPLNQGPVPGQPSLTTTGSQYGGGAADFASVAAGIQGSIDYLDMADYAGIKAALENNNPAAARAALIASPWAASHYGNGADFSTAPLPGQASAISGTPGQSTSSTGSGSTATTTSFLGIPSLSDLTGDLEKAGAYLVAIGAGAALVVAGIYKLANPGKSISSNVAQAAPLAAMAA